MKRLNFDSQRLPPFLVGYFIDSKVGEREIVASIMNLIIRGDIFLHKKEDKYYVRKVGTNPKNRFEELILENIDEDEIRTIDVMRGLRARKKEIYEEFKNYLEIRYNELTKKKKSNFFLSFSFKLFSGDKTLHELERTYGENHILPILPEEDKRSLLELTRFLKEHPVNEGNVAAEFMPYSIALGLNNFWMRQFTNKSHIY